MSLLLGNNIMANPFYHEFKKQVSFFLKEKIKTARLALTDVTPAELLAEEATDGDLLVPETRTMGLISRAAFEVDDFWRIVEILHKRLLRFDRTNWRVSYKALILLEYLLTHGPRSVAEEFHEIDRNVIQKMRSFQYVDNEGSVHFLLLVTVLPSDLFTRTEFFLCRFNWGHAVKKKSERIMNLLEDEQLLKEERDRARKVTRGIEGFGRLHSSSADGSLKELSLQQCNSHCNNHRDQEGLNSISENPVRNTKYWDSLGDGRILEKENLAPTNALLTGKFHKWNCTRESKPLLGSQKDKQKVE
ncbi:hypothetical protein HHK36_016423 [Tetracentron sinense]|uniref:ENTH domain-containing protein n=1 Tax=Tetracentron sinense TaxID=13715 RepID=A0A834Z593_TETSI|nr:hypothetical protein HHK36_016423 [Tetracentron sinense]